MSEEMPMQMPDTRMWDTDSLIGYEGLHMGMNRMDSKARNYTADETPPFFDGMDAVLAAHDLGNGSGW